MRPLRILFLSRYAYPDGPGGGQVSGRLLALAVAGQGNVVRFACLREGLKEVQREKDGPLEVVRYPYRRLGLFRRFSNTYLTFRQLAAIASAECAEFRPDIVHFLNFDSLLLGAPAVTSRGVVTVATVNGPGFFCGTQDGLHADGSECLACNALFKDCIHKWGLLRGPFQYLYASLLMALTRRAYHHIDMFQTVSGAMQRGMLSMGVPLQRTAVIPNPVVLDSPVRSEIRAVPHGAFVLLYTGRVAPDKNLALVIRSLPLLPTNVVFVIVGDGQDMRNIRRLASALGVGERVIHVGSVPHAAVPTYVQRADVVVLPSLVAEAFSRSVIEGMSLEKPAIVSDRGGNPDLVEDSEGGFVIPPSDVNAFRTAVLALMNNHRLARTIGARGKKWVHANLSPKRIGSRLCMLYKEAAR